MASLILGLVLFLGIHAVRIVAEPGRQALIARHGLLRWRLLQGTVALLGLGLIVSGYAQARLDPVLLWQPPVGLRHPAALLTLLAFVLAAAAWVPGNALKARLGHPMLAGVKLWAFAHLLANGSLADGLLFGSFLLWAVAGFAVGRRRDRRAGTVAGPVSPARTALTVALGTAAWAGFALWAHAAWIGVAPFGA